MSDKTETRKKWKHLPRCTYFAFTERWVGSLESFDTERSQLSGEYGHLKAAIKAGFRAVECDDFAIGVMLRGTLIEVLWMDEVRGDAPEDIAEIANSLSLGVRRER